MTKKIFFIFCSIYMPVVLAEDWDMGEERSHSLGLRSGYGEEWSKGIDLLLALPMKSEFSADYLQADFSTDDEQENFDKYLITLSSDPLSTWSVQLDYGYSGNSSSLEKKDIGVGIQYYPENWLLKVRYLRGDAEVFVRQDLIDAGLFARRSFKMDRNAIEVTFQYEQKNWVWSIAGINYQYSREISLIPENFRIQQVFGASSLHQLFGLLDWYVAANMGHQYGNHFWRIGYAEYELEVSGDNGKSPYVSWDYPLNDSISLSLLSAIGLDQSDHYGEAALRFYF